MCYRLIGRSTMRSESAVIYFNFAPRHGLCSSHLESALSILLFVFITRFHCLILHICLCLTLSFFCYFFNVLLFVFHTHSPLPRLSLLLTIFGQLFSSQANAPPNLFLNRFYPIPNVSGHFDHLQNVSY